MEIICVFKCSSFHWASPSHQCSWWPCRSLAEEEWPGQRAGHSRAPGSAAAWLWTMSPCSPARTCISDPIYDLAEGFNPGCGLQQLKRHKWCSNWVENGHHLSPEPGDSTHRAFGDCGCDRKNRAGLRLWPLSWGRCCTQKYCIFYHTPNVYFLETGWLHKPQQTQVSPTSCNHSYRTVWQAALWRQQGLRSWQEIVTDVITQTILLNSTASVLPPIGYNSHCTDTICSLIKHRGL